MLQEEVRRLEREREAGVHAPARPPAPGRRPLVIEYSFARHRPLGRIWEGTPNAWDSSSWLIREIVESKSTYIYLQSKRGTCLLLGSENSNQSVRIITPSLNLSTGSMTYLQCRLRDIEGIQVNKHQEPKGSSAILFFSSRKIPSARPLLTLIEDPPIPSLP